MTAELPNHVFPTFIVGADQPTLAFADGVEFHEPLRTLAFCDDPETEVVQCTCGRGFSDAKLLEAHLAEVAG